MKSEVLDCSVADIAFETSERYGSGGTSLPVFGVQKDVGLTPEARYTSKDLSRYKCIRPGDFAYNPMRLNIGSIGMCLPEHGAALVSPDYVTFRLKSRVLPKFFRYLTLTPQWSAWTNQAGTGSVRSRIYFSQLGTMKVRIPSLEGQAAIVSMLDVLEAGIANLADTNATLEAIAQSIFKSWFIDFDPVKAKSVGRVPDGIDAATAALFPDSFEESALGAIPRGWRMGSLADLAALNPESWTGKSHPAKVLYIDLANAKNNELASLVEYPFDEAPSRARRVLRDGDTIVGTVRPGNRSFAFIDEPATNLTASTGFAVLRPRTEAFREYVFLAATNDASIDHLAHVADGGAYPAVRPDVVASLKSVIPSDEVMTQFHGICAPVLAAIAANQREAQTLSELRDTLLPRLISGKLKLPELQELAEAL